MIIFLSPVAGAARIAYLIHEEKITGNGVAIDLSALTDGDEYTSPVDWLISARRVDGELHVELQLGHGWNAPHETRFPEPLINPPDGPLALPPYGEDQPFAAPVADETGPYAAIRAAMTADEKSTMAVRLTGTGTANRALQGIVEDAVAGVHVEQADLLAAMVAAGVITQDRARRLA